MIRKEVKGVTYYEFEHLARTGLVHHCFSSRLGGVSKPPFTSLNLAYHMGDDPANVDENFSLISKAMGANSSKIVMTHQIHQAEIHVVAHESPVPEGTDGLITTLPDYILTTYYADCVPLLFLDPTKKVIANSHAGWRGTMAGIAAKTIEKMVNQFGCRPQDILVGIGPAISVRHFEVGSEVVEAFKFHLPWTTPHLYPKPKQKWHIDLPKINHQLLIRSGVKAEHIEISDLCTVEHPEIFYSHRRDGTARGNMAAMIALKKEISTSYNDEGEETKR